MLVLPLMFRVAIFTEDLVVLLRRFFALGFLMVEFAVASWV